MENTTKIDTSSDNKIDTSSDNIVIQEVISIVKKCSNRILHNQYCTIEGLAGAGKSTIVEGLKARFKENLLSLPELHLSENKEQTTLNYLIEERTRSNKIITTSTPKHGLILSDRSVISTIIVAASKELSGMNTEIPNWERLKSWFSIESNIKTLVFPSVVIYPSIGADISINRQMDREKYRRPDSIFMNSEFCLNSKKMYDELLFHLGTMGIKFLCFDNSTITEDLAIDTTFNFLTNALYGHSTND